VDADVAAVTGRRLMAVSWAMPPALYPRSIQVSRLLKGLHLRGWQSTVVTRRTDNLTTGEFLDHALADLGAPHYTLAPIEADNDRQWIDRTVAAVTERDRHNPADALVTFAQPWRDHLAGLELASWRGNRPWIAHFSDPWVDSPYRANVSDEQHAIDCGCEAQVMTHADAVVFTNTYAADLVMSKYPKTWRHKVHVVPHSTDRSSMPRALTPAAANRPLRITYVGQLAGQRTATGLFEAVRLLSRRISIAERLELRFVGDLGALSDAKTVSDAANLSAVTTFVATVSHGESLAEMARADVLVMVDAPAERNVFLPSKFADYLMADKPILGLTPAIGASADALREIGHQVIDPDDGAGIADALEQLVSEHEAGTLALPPGARVRAERYSLDNTAAAFAAIVEEAIGQRAS
jgi:glycosyltransferase involved in cell wall biosynthesis